MFTDAHGSDLPLDPFLHNHDQLLTRSIQANLVHVKCYRALDVSCILYFSAMIALYHHEMKVHEMGVLLRFRLLIILRQIILLPYATLRIIVMLAYP